ncbi:uroporphyrinogen-III synthase [Prorops nasuta]|uniref:uroporphyrinogen-III synthase n=1 Tax=Prorops nasuta TaxID=863751 RepID=UPI0034CD5AFE
MSAHESSQCKNVVLCKGQSEDIESHEIYIKTIQSAGYLCSYLYTLRFEFFNQLTLEKCLLSPDIYSGLILTSRRAVEALGNVLKEKKLLNQWTQMSTYCVGPATENLAKNIGLQNCLGSQSGNAEELAKIIIQEKSSSSKPLLYPCSEIARDTIEKELSKREIKFHKLIVYRPVAVETLEHDFLQIVTGFPLIFVFFSPSIVEHISNILKQHPKEMINIKAVAIGPVTAEALRKTGFTVCAVANKPKPTSLLEAIKEADQFINR